MTDNLSNTLLCRFHRPNPPIRMLRSATINIILQNALPSATAPV